jgi:outer membrane protein
MPARLGPSLRASLAAILWTAIAPAPANAAPRAMTLDEALAYAHAHQPALRSALARVAVAAADARVPRAQWLPSFGATLQAFEGTTNNTTASYVGDPEFDLPRIGSTKVGAAASGSAAAWTPSTSMLGAVGGRQEVLDFGRIAAEAAVADLSYQVESHRADAERLRLELVVKEAFYGVLGARAVLRAAEDAFQRSSLHRDMAAAGVKSGLHAPIELTRAEADLTRFDVGQLRAGGAVRSAQAVFAAAVGVEDPLLDAAGEPPALRPAPPLGEALERASQMDPLIKASRSGAAQADALTRAIASETRPSLALTATISGRAGTATPSSGSLTDQDGPLPTVPNWDVGLVLRWPFYDPVVGARRDAAAARSGVARADLELLTQQERATVQEVYVTLEVSQAALVSLDHAVQAARANYAQAEARFKAGLGTSLELADAEAVRTDAEIQMAVGEFEARRARAALARLLAEDL